MRQSWVYCLSKHDKLCQEVVLEMSEPELHPNWRRCWCSNHGCGVGYRLHISSQLITWRKELHLKMSLAWPCKFALTAHGSLTSVIRSFHGEKGMVLSRTRGRFDIIFIPFMDGWKSSAHRCPSAWFTEKEVGVLLFRFTFPVKKLPFSSLQHRPIRFTILCGSSIDTEVLGIHRTQQPQTPADPFGHCNLLPCRGER